MADYTLIESSDPFAGDRFARRLAASLADAGNDVALFLVDNGTLAARAGCCDDWLAGLVKSGVTIYADEFALAERGITADRLASGVTVTSLATLVDHLAAGRKAIWH